MGEPSPLSPWQEEPFARYTVLPCAAVPRPGGRPVPSGRTSMFQVTTSSSVIDWPRPYCPALLPAGKAEPATQSSASPTVRRSRVDIRHLAARRDLPALD